MKTLRLLSYFMVIALCVGFVSCSDDDDEKNYSTLIVGTWQLTHTKGWEMYQGEKDTWDKDDNSEFFVIKADGSGYTYDLGYENEREPFTWYINGNTVTIEDDEISKITINELTSNKLVVTHGMAYGDEGECTDTYRKIN